MTCNLITVDKNTYESLQQELTELRQIVGSNHCFSTLKSRQQQMQLFIEYTPAAIAVFDCEMRYLLVSQRWREDYSLGDEEIIGRSHYEIFPEISQNWREIHQRCLTGAIETSEEDIFIRANGTTEWVKWEIHPWHEESGAVGGIIMFTEVITTRKQTEIALANSEKFLRNIAANVPGAIFQFTNHNGVWRVDYVSDFIQELAGISAAAAMQNFDCFAACIHPEDIESFTASVVEVIENPIPWHYEGRLIKPTGEVVWWQGDSTPIRNNQGEVIFCGVLLDITQRKQAEAELKRLNEELEARVEERTAELRHSEARLQRLADNVPGMLYEFCLKPDGTVSFPYASSRCQEILGLAPAEIKEDASFAFSLIHPDDVGEVQQAIANSAQTLQNFDSEWRMMTLAGKKKWVKAFSFPERQIDGEIIWYGCLFDISDRQKTQQQLQGQAQFLQSIWEGVDYGIFVLDVLDDGAEFRYVKFNPAILQLSPMPLESFVGRTMAAALPADMAYYYRRRYQECIKLRKSVFFEESFWHNNQENWWLLNITPLFDSNSQITQLVVTTTDITEPKQAEQDRQIFVSLIENSSDFIGFATLEGKALFLNEAGRNIVGVESLEFVKNSQIIDYIFPEDRQYLLQEILPIVIKQGVWQGELRFRHLQTEKPIPVDYNMFVIKNPETSEPMCFATITRDASERKEAENKLQAQEQFLRSIYDGVPQLIFVVDVLENGEFRFAGCNSSAEKSMGMNHAKIIGKTPEELLGTLEGAVVRQRYQSCIDAGKEITYEECLTFNEQETWWFTTLNPLINNQGIIYQIVGTTWDITERKQAEAALQASQHFIQRIADSSPNILYIFDLEEQRNIYANQELETLLGYSNTEIQQMGDNLLPIIMHPGDRERVMLHHQQFLTTKDGDIVEIEFRVRRVNGEWCWLYCRETPFNRDEEGNIKQILGVSTDITERKQTEIQLQAQAQNLENTLRELQRTQAQLIHSEKMSSVGNMVAGVAHEINNPVNFIHGNLIPASEYVEDLLHLLELYEQYYPEPAAEIQAEIDDMELDFLKEDLIKLLQSMRVGTQRIREIVLSLRNFSRLDEAEFKLVNIHEGLDSTLMILHHRLKAKADNSEIAVIKEYGKLPLVDCYPGQLNQVFMNILSNAIDALEDSSLSNGEEIPNPQIRIRTEVVNSNLVAIHIADNGKGIPPGIVSKLFDPFFTTKDVGKGTGLGLSISYQIVVDRHGGKLYCNSAPGKGAEFVLEIPITQPDVPT
ncbi:two-component sensor histidine kinase [Nostoc carneum NIES-2107]|nr:two-component sensor histidine kinase [Nostoc carneum NIES-2107]